MFILHVFYIDNLGSTTSELPHALRFGKESATVKRIVQLSHANRLVEVPISRFRRLDTPSTIVWTLVVNTG